MSSTSWFAWLFIVSLAFVVGCNDPGGSTAPRVDPARTEQSDREQMGRRLLANASDMLNTLDNYDEGTIENALQQMIRRTNEGLAMLPGGAPDAATLSVEDGRVLREAVWIRDGARYAVGEETDPLRRGERLFDWTIRNFQLIPPDAPEAKLPYLPWHLLLLGRATALDRAWLFQLLARQQQLDVVLLAFPGEKPGTAPNNLKIWCAALVVDKQLYLFDPRIGAPIYTKDGKHVATLTQVAADDGLLRALDLPNDPYPVKADDLKRLVAVLEVSSMFVEPRFSRVGRELLGKNRLELETRPDRLEAQLKDVPGIVETVRRPLRDERFADSRSSKDEEKNKSFLALKELLTPFNLPRTSDGRFVPSPLLKARVRHVSGKYYENPNETDPDLLNLSINFHYHQARPADEDLLLVNAQRDSKVWALAHRVRQDATYWLGTVAYDLKNYDTAKGYFDVILAKQSSADWTVGARYNLGRTYEAQAEAAREAAAKAEAAKNAAEAAKQTAAAAEFTKKALETYRATFLDTPPDAQALERAKWLESQAASGKTK